MVTATATAPRLARAAKFGIVGVVGLAINLVAQVAFIKALGVNYLVAAILADPGLVHRELPHGRVVGLRCGRNASGTSAAIPRVHGDEQRCAGSSCADDVGADVALRAALHAVELRLARRDDVDPLRDRRHGHLADTDRRPLQGEHRARRRVRSAAATSSRGGHAAAEVAPARARRGRGVRGSDRSSPRPTSPQSASTATRPSTRGRAPRCSGWVTQPSTSRCSARIRCCCSRSSAPRSAVFGQSDFAARFVVAMVFGVGSVALTYALGAARERCRHRPRRGRDVRRFSRTT